MNRILPLSLLIALVAPATGLAQFGSAPRPVSTVSGLDPSAADPATRAQDDTYRAVNGRWLATAVIPPDRLSTGVAERLQDETQLQLRALIEDAAKNGGANAKDAAEAADSKKLGDLYTSFIDEAQVDALGFKPIQPELARIDAMRSKAELAALIGRLDRLGVDTPFSANVHQDAKDATRYVVDLSQGGIGLPDRDYFLNAKDQRFAKIRSQYVDYIAQMLTMIGDPAPEAEAKAVFQLENGLARAQWDRVANRDPVKTYNPYRLAALPGLAPHFDWKGYLAAAEIDGKVESLVISQPGFIRGLDAAIARVPLATWKAYLKMRLLDAYAPFLSKPFVDARFAFNGTVLNGIPENRPRWKNGVRLVESAIGEGLGRLYVAKYFPPESKARMDELVRNLLAAYRESIDGLDWMTPATKREAQAKLAKFTPKIGYPSSWRDYGGLELKSDDLVGNVERARSFEYRRNVAKLGRPVDRAEWFMTPQTINAYYNPEINEVVFPAAYLQPPFFNPAADDAVNYGAVGATIGHEISHGFDDKGSQYDGDGNLRMWWTADDRKRFGAKTKALVAQYGAYRVAGYHVNGALTLGENIADNSGLAIALKAYHMSLNGRPAPVIDGMTGDQRFFLGYAMSWQEKIRDEAIIAQIKSDPHAPGEFRANGALMNQDAFYDAFGVKPGDRMYLAPDQRVRIW